MEPLEMHLLGAPRFERHGAPIAADTRKAFAILAYAAVTDEEHRREELAAMFWPEFDESKARAALRRTLSVLKKAVGPGVLEVTRDSLSITTGMVCLDVVEFTRLASGDDVKTLNEAIALYRDEFLTGFTLRDAPPFDDWQYYQGEKYRDLLLRCLETLIELHTLRGEFEPAITAAQRWIEIDPLREEAHRSLMRLYTWTGRRSAALKQYRDCLRILEAELGVPPLEETESLYQLIKRNALEAPRVIKLQKETGEAAKLMTAGGAPATPRSGPLPLVGRSEELKRVEFSFGEVGPQGRFLVVEGEAGIGKTRLVQEFLARRKVEGSQIIASRCYEGEQQLAYAPVIEALVAGSRSPESGMKLKTLPLPLLAECLRLAPELAQLLGKDANLTPVPTMAGADGQRLLLSAISEVFTIFCSGPGPGIIFLDDVHWADPATLDWLSFFARRMKNRPILILVTVRWGDLPSVPRIRSLLAECERAGTGSSLRLERLPQDAVFELVKASAGAGAGELAGKLFEETEGLPFFVVEYLASLRPDQSESDGAPFANMPRGVRNLLHNRIAETGATALQILQTAAAIGHAFDQELIQAASGRSELEIVQGLEEALKLDLIRERATPGPAPRYDFNHSKLRAIVYEEMSLARRRLLHKRLADALKSKAERTRELAPQAGLIATHFRLAGRDAEAADFMAIAGDHARSLFANAEALAHYETALALGYKDSARLHEACGDLLTQLGSYGAAINSYESAASLSDSEVTAGLEHKIGQVYYRRGDFDLAEQQYQLAERRWQNYHGSIPIAFLYADWANLAYRRDQMKKAQQKAERALALAEQASDGRALAHAHNILGTLARKHDPPGALVHLSKSLECAEDSGLLDARVAALNNLGLVKRAAGDLEEALQHFEQALDLCRVYGDRHIEAALHNNIADVHHAAGRKNAAMSSLKHAVAILTEIDRDEVEWQPEIWKLTEW